MTEFIIFIFKCLNLGVFAALSFYFFRTRVAPMLKQHLHDERMRKHAKRAYEADLGLRIDEAGEHHKQQTELYDLLLQKTMQWNDAVDERDKAIDLEKERCKKMMQRRLADRRSGQERDNVAALLLPQVIADLESDARHYYANKEHAHHAFDSIIKQLKESVHEK